MSEHTIVVPSPAVRAVAPYVPWRHPAPFDVDLAGTETPTEPAGAAADALSDALAAQVGALGRYPDARPLAELLARRFGVDSAAVLITAGADEALDRACRAFGAPGRSALITEPTFEMVPRYVALSGAEARATPWNDGPLDVEAMLACADQSTSLAIVVSPNNPTGTVAPVEAIRRLHDALPSAVIVVDLAYVEYADTDPSAELLTLPRVVVMRTFSKAWGMPGLRVGFALGDPELIGWMRRAGGPYAVSSASLAAVTAVFNRAPQRRDGTVRRIRACRAELRAMAAMLGADAVDGQGNFACITGRRARWVFDALAGLGISTRCLGAAGRERTRITIPVADAVWDRLVRGLRASLVPDAILFDLDGVLADVSRSYREAIRLTAERFGVSVAATDIAAAKAAGNANDDWALTADLIRSRGRSAPLDEVTRVFESLYQAGSGTPGLRMNESLTVPRAWLAALRSSRPLGIVTGRPRADAERFLEVARIRDLFGVVVAREDAPLKPDPAPILAALRSLGVASAWFIGDTPDDVVAARAAGVVPIGVLPPGERDGASLGAALLAAGAARILPTLTSLDECLS